MNKLLGNEQIIEMCIMCPKQMAIDCHGKSILNQSMN